MRIGLIGLGRIGQFHARTLAALDAVEALIVTDVAPGRAAEGARGLGVHSADSVEELLTSGVDGVVIAAATNAHPALLTACVGAGLPVFCEKPVAGTAKEAAALADRLEPSGVSIQIGYPRRFDAAFLAARDAVRTGALGWLTTIRSTTLDPAPPPQDYLAVSGGIFHDCAVHDFDMVRWVTGREVGGLRDRQQRRRGLDRRARRRRYRRHRAHAGRWHAGRRVQHPLQRARPRRAARAARVSGQRRGRPGRQAVAWFRRTWCHVSGRPPHQFFMDRFGDAFRAELVACTEVVGGTRPSPCSVADAVETSLVAEAATVSWREHRPVRVDEVRG